MLSMPLLVVAAQHDMLSASVWCLSLGALNMLLHGVAIWAKATIGPKLKEVVPD